MPSEPNVGWADSQLLQTIAQFPGAGDDALQPDDIRFLRGVAKLVKRRLHQQSADDSAPSVFFLQPTPPDPIAAESIELHPMLDNGETSIGGRAWFVGPVVLSGRSCSLEWATDAAVFDHVVQQLGLGDVAAVVFDPRPEHPQIRFYPEGLASFDICRVTEITFGTVHMDDVLTIVDRVHAKQLVTPDGQSEVGKLWQNKGKHWAAEKAELIVQMYLVTALNAALPTCTIRSEQPQVSGRLDIEIEEADEAAPEHIVRHALLELKVLRSFGSTGTPVSDQQIMSWIAEGLDQAYAYRVERGATASALCCFDMRKTYSGGHCFDAVKERAAELDVVLGAWHLFATAKHQRRHTTSLAVGAT